MKQRLLVFIMGFAGWIKCDRLNAWAVRKHMGL